MGPRPISAVVFFLVGSGCLGTVDITPAPPGELGGPASLRFSLPFQLTGDLGGFEPSIRTGPEGNIYAAAAKTTRPNAGERLADWAWYSRDGGVAWQPLPLGPLEIGRFMVGLEGDLAVDGRGRVYYADTHGADDTLHRWSVGADRQAAWDWSRPLIPTVDVLDDRPYMAAQGDGIVYLMSNNGVEPPGPQNALHDPYLFNDTGAAIWLFASPDAGLTWSLGWGFAGELMCAPTASRTDDVTVTVTCARGSGVGATMTVYRSTDRAATFQTVWSTNYSQGPGYLNPWPAADAAGWTYAAWLDDRVDWSGIQTATWAGEAPGRVMFARSSDGKTWERFDVTPFSGRFGMSHVSAGPSGVVAISFHATSDLTPDKDTQWYGYALVTADAHAADSAWQWIRLEDQPTVKGPVPPRNFFQNAVGPDGRAHVILQRNRPAHAGESPVARGPPADVLYLGQLTGPNLSMPSV